MSKQMFITQKLQLWDADGERIQDQRIQSVCPTPDRFVCVYTLLGGVNGATP